MRRAVIDIGTNSILLLIAEMDAEYGLRVIRDETRIVRLGEGIDRTCTISDEALNRAVGVLREYTALCRELSAAVVGVIGTAVFRRAHNRQAVVGKIETATSYSVNVLSGEHEAALSFRSVLPADTAESGETVVIDIGGGSTEIIYGTPRKIFSSHSLAIGSVVLTERYIRHDPPTGDEITGMREDIRSHLAVCEKISPVSAVGTAGTVTTLAAVKHGCVRYDPAVIESSTLTRNDVRALLDSFTAMTAQDRLGIPGMEKGREDVIVPGTLILFECMECFGLPSVSVSTRGIRYGYLIEQARNTAGRRG